MELLYSVACLLLAISLCQAQVEVRHRPPPGCEGIQCGVPRCQPDETIKLSPGACCPGCVNVRLTPPIDCSLVRCAFPECLNGEPYKPAGQCCFICPDGGCVYKGKHYSEGKTFNDNCNTCTCHNGRAACTKMLCLQFEQP